MRYFVTGATGYIGGALARRLLSDGHEVAALVRDPERARPLAELGAELHRGDITDRESMKEAMEGADGVFHLAAWYRIGASDSSQAERINVGGTHNVLELMRDLAIPKGVYTSTLAVFSDTGGEVVDESYRHDPAKGFVSEYDRTKYLAHYRVALPLMEGGLPVVIVQPGLVYGPDDPSATGELLRRYLQRRLPVVPAGPSYTWGYLDDIVEGHVLAMEAGVPGESYIIAGPIHSLVEALELAERITGIPAPRLRPSPGLMRVLAGLMSLVGRFAKLEGDVHPETLRIAAGSGYLGSNAKARRELGYRPRELEVGLPPTLRHEMARLGLTGERPADSDGA